MDRSSCAASYHGNYVAFKNDGCRCPDAREDYRLYRKRRREGRAQPRRYPALGYIRMIRALMAVGWPLHIQAQMCGVPRWTLDHLPYRGFVIADTAQRIERMFVLRDNEDGPSRVTEAWAWRMGYPPPGAWTGLDIHDPHAEPHWPRRERPTGPDPVAAEMVVRARLGFDALAEADQVEAYRLAVRQGISHRRMRDEWGVSEKALKDLRAAA